MKFVFMGWSANLWPLWLAKKAKPPVTDHPRPPPEAPSMRAQRPQAGTRRPLKRPHLP